MLSASVCLLVIATGLALLWITRWQRTGKAIVTLGFAVLTAFSYEPVANALLSPLEQRYPAWGRGTVSQEAQGQRSNVKGGSYPLSAAGYRNGRREADGAPNGVESQGLRAERNARESIRHVVVLGGGHDADPRLPVTSRLTDASLKRLVEGVRIYRALDDASLVVSGGGAFGPDPNATALAEVARILGVPEKDILTETRSRDTKDQAHYVKEIVGEGRFVLVTSASHLPRSVALFRRQGLDPIPAPARHLATRDSALSPDDFFPHSFDLYKSYRAVYEYLGLSWAKLRGQIE